MGQPSELTAFRKRLKNAGYFDIHIKHNDGEWIVSAREPLGGYCITIQTKGVDNLFRKRLHGGGFTYQPKPKEQRPIDGERSVTADEKNRER